MDDAEREAFARAKALKEQARPYKVEIRGKRITLSREGYRFARSSPTPRGPIVTFSRKARGRMLRKIAEIDWLAAGEGLFLTLTYPDACADHSMHERAKHRFLVHRWVEHTIGHQVACIWRVEWMPRQSGLNIGKILPHMHLLFFAKEGLDEEKLRALWCKTIGAKQHTQIKLQRVDTGNMVSVYAAKYCSKVVDASSLDNVPYHNKTGRHAGWLREKLIPYHPRDIFERVNKAIVLALKQRACETLWWFDPRYDDGFSIIGDQALEIIKDFYGIALDRMGIPD